MSKTIKHILIGVTIGAGVAGVFVPFGDSEESLWDRAMNKKDELEA